MTISIAQAMHQKERNSNCLLFAGVVISAASFYTLATTGNPIAGYVLCGGLVLMAIGALLAMGVRSIANLARATSGWKKNMGGVQDEEIGAKDLELSITLRQAAMLSGLLGIVSASYLAAEGFAHFTFGPSYLNIIAIAGVAIGLALMTAFAGYAVAQDIKQARNYNEYKPGFFHDIRTLPTTRPLAMVGALCAGSGLILKTQGFDGLGINFLLAGTALMLVGLILNSFATLFEEVVTLDDPSKDSYGSHICITHIVGAIIATGSAVNVLGEALSSGYVPSLSSANMIALMCGVAITLIDWCCLYIKKQAADAKNGNPSFRPPSVQYQYLPV